MKSNNPPIGGGKPRAVNASIIRTVLNDGDKLTTTYTLEVKVEPDGTEVYKVVINQMELAETAFAINTSMSLESEGDIWKKAKVDFGEPGPDVGTTYILAGYISYDENEKEDITDLEATVQAPN